MCTRPAPPICTDPAQVARLAPGTASAATTVLAPATKTPIVASGMATVVTGVCAPSRPATPFRAPGVRLWHMGSAHTMTALEMRTAYATLGKLAGAIGQASIVMLVRKTSMVLAAPANAPAFMDSVTMASMVQVCVPVTRTGEGQHALIAFPAGLELTASKSAPTL